MSQIPEDVMKLAKEAHARFADSRVTDNLTDIIALAILTDREARSGWRDIASLTPEDGMIVVGYGEYRERDGFSPAFMRWHAVLNGWTVTGMPFYPTHWMPIPAAPSEATSPSREETETRDTSALLLEAEKETLVDALEDIRDQVHIHAADVRCKCTDADMLAEARLIARAALSKIRGGE